MASDQITPPKRDSPLSFMQSFNSEVSYFEPTASSSVSSTGRNPELIVVLAWFAARDVHIAKYITQHRALFPTSRILLIRISLFSMLYPPQAAANIKVALPILRSFADNSNGSVIPRSHPRVLVHVFSNGGMTLAAKMYRMLGYFHWMRTHRALSQAVPRFVSPLMHLVMAVAWLVGKSRGRIPPVNENAQTINAKQLVSCESRRLYLYGTADEMVDWRDVEDHARIASERGFVVRMEKFERGKHVAHIMSSRLLLFGFAGGPLNLLTIVIVGGGSLSGTNLNLNLIADIADAFILFSAAVALLVELVILNVDTGNTTAKAVLVLGLEAG
ncbi:hypothetical protein HJFPF1_07937 [Paramyrothecium foliicola]|nr:hypothetical protein HJFPF1_07937 [Paramyrothecium foliicola]